MRTTISLGFVWILLLGVLVQPASAATLTVCASGCDHATIQAAVDAAAAGDVIDVAAETFTEDVVIATDDLTLSGANAGVAAGVSPGARGPETVLEGRISTSGTVADLDVDGFTLMPPTGNGMRLTGAGTINVVNNIIDGGTPDGSGVGTVTFDAINFFDNTMSSFQYILNLDGGATTLARVLRNDINTFEFVGVLLQGSAQGAADITDNRISGGGSGSAGIALATDNNVISGNEIFDVNTGVALVPDGGGTSNNTITFNHIHDTDFAVYGAPSSGGEPFDNNQVNRNRILDNGVGIRNDNATELDGTCNWWGTAGGPTGSDVVGNVDADPFLPVDDLLAVCGDVVESCNGLAATIVGTEGDDTLAGTDGDDVIVGLGGNDTITGGLGDDTICAGDGDDVVDSGFGEDYVEGGAGMDELRGNKDADVLLGGPDADYIRGQGGRDTVRGGDGDDVLYGNDARDFVYGDAGNDLILGGRGSDRMFGGPGDDELDGSIGNDTLRGEAGNDLLLGGDDDDKLVGGPDTDTCDGQGGTNTVISCEL